LWARVVLPEPGGPLTMTSVGVQITAGYHSPSAIHFSGFGSDANPILA
jgi:hypothetical protein